MRVQSRRHDLLPPYRVPGAAASIAAASRTTASARADDAGDRQPGIHAQPSRPGLHLALACCSETETRAPSCHKDYPKHRAISPFGDAQGHTLGCAKQKRGGATQQRTAWAHEYSLHASVSHSFEIGTCCMCIIIIDGGIPGPIGIAPSEGRGTQRCAAAHWRNLPPLPAGRPRGAVG